MYRCRPWRAPERAAPAPAHLSTRAAVVPYQPDATARGAPALPTPDITPVVQLAVKPRPERDKLALGGAPVLRSRAARKTTQLPPRSFFGPTRRNQVFWVPPISADASATSTCGHEKHGPLLTRRSRPRRRFVHPSSFVFPDLSDCEIRIVDFIFGIYSSQSGSALRIQQTACSADSPTANFFADYLDTLIRHIRWIRRGPFIRQNRSRCREANVTVSIGRRPTRDREIRWVDVR